MGNDTFHFIEIPEHFKEIIGVPDPGTKLYRASGSEEDGTRWANAIFEICHGDGCVSPGGAAMLARVTRPGVHQKIKAGGLTGFVFHVETKSFTGKKKLSANANTYCFLPVSECKAWAQELSKKRDKSEIQKEAMGDGNFNDMYLDEPPKHLKKKHEIDQKRK